MIPETSPPVPAHVLPHERNVITMEKAPPRGREDYSEMFWYYWKKEKDNSVDDWY